MILATALFLTASGAAQTGSASDMPMRDQILPQAKSQARASVTILQPEVIDFEAMKARGERASIRHDARGTVWLEFS